MEHPDTHASCDCEHEHSHHDDCGCGHDHDHHEGCDCGHEHRPIEPIEGLTALQQNVLLALYERHYLPVARFAMQKAQEDAAYAVALAPVYLSDPVDSMEDVKALGQSLQQLEDHGLLTLDYDLQLKGYAYAEYKASALYADFAQMVAEGSGRSGHLFDTPLLELGSMALTEQGNTLVEAMIG